MQCVVLAAADSVDDHHRCDREASKVVTGWQKKPFLVASMGLHHVGQHYSDCNANRQLQTLFEHSHLFRMLVCFDASHSSTEVLSHCLR